MYHISDLKKFKRCPCYYFLTKDDDNSFAPYLRVDESISDLLIKKFRINEYFLGYTGDSMERFFLNEEKYEWFIRPRFSDKELRVNIPLMHKCENGYDLYFVIYNTLVRELDLFTYRVSLAVLERAGLIVNKIYIVYFNRDYEYKKELDVDKLLIVSDKYAEAEIIDIVNDDILDHNELIRQIESTSLNDYEPKKNKYCLSFGECPFIRDCFKDYGSFEDDSIMYLVSNNLKLDMYNAGIRHLKDADISLFKANRVQYAQIMASQNGGLFIEKHALKNFLKPLDTYPIAFVDFEWDRYLIPKYEKMKPMDVVCFEYALYVLHADGKLDHYTFVGSQDCRKEFVEGLIKYLPKDGPILAYNAIGAEVLRLKELAQVFPEYKNELTDIINRFVDLAIPFSEGLIYDTRMRGNFTLKRLVDICSNYTYKNLDINDGMKAVYSWRDIDKDIAVDKEKIIRDLEEYCSLDAYGLFLVYNWLKELINKEDI